MNEDNRNLLIAVTAIAVIFIIWEIFYLGPQRDQLLSDQPTDTVQNGTITQDDNADALFDAPSDTGIAPEAATGIDAAAPVSQQASVNIEIASPALVAQMALIGAKLDTGLLQDYQVSIDPDSDKVNILAAADSRNPFYANFGWFGAAVETPKLDSVWQLQSRDTAGNRFTIVWQNDAGIEFKQHWHLNENYMFDVELEVNNNSQEDIQLATYGLIRRTGTPDIQGFYILHEGLIGVFDETLEEIDYDDLQDEGKITFNANASWLGFTDKYWLAALIPQETEKLSTNFTARNSQLADYRYQSDFATATKRIGKGASDRTSHQLFVGAKQVKLLQRYQATGISLFERATDFGWYYFLTKPIFALLSFIADHVSNFGIAILVLTILVRIVLFPLAQKSYYSMSKMKKLAPEIKKLRELYGDDRTKLSMETMALYKQEKINPMAGCLPLLVQLPIFFCLYKVLFVTIEMRHAPFFGWIRDLSAPDPNGLLTLFGLIDWQVPGILAIANIGLWPIFMGLTMYLQMKLNPTPTEPLQKQIFTFLPIIFTFILGGFPAGLVIYWTWSNVLSIGQQWLIMRRLGVKISDN